VNGRAHAKFFRQRLVLSASILAIAQARREAISTATLDRQMVRDASPEIEGEVIRRLIERGADYGAIACNQLPGFQEAERSNSQERVNRLAVLPHARRGGEKGGALDATHAIIAGTFHPSATWCDSDRESYEHGPAMDGVT